MANAWKIVTVISRTSPMGPDGLLITYSFNFRKVWAESIWNIPAVVRKMGGGGEWGAAGSSETVVHIHQITRRQDSDQRKAYVDKDNGCLLCR